MDEVRKVGGILFIGDPHLSSRRPGRRKDVDFGSVVLGKIAHLIDVCNERRFLPCFLGDMFDGPVEPDEKLKTRLARILRGSWTRPVANVGNHDIRNVVLSDGDSLAYLAESGVIDVCAQSGAFATVDIGGRKVGIGATPYGQDFPLDARPYFPADVSQIVWLTHHDVAFENPYPGSIAPQAIAGCRLVVNGHMHLRKRVLKKGGTVWFNPGNITRQAADAMLHDPAAFALTPSGNLEKVPVPHGKDVFDLTGKLISAVSPGEAPVKEVGGEGEFVNLLRADAPMEMARSDDASILLEEIEEKFERDRVPAAVRNLVLELHAMAAAAGK